MNTKNLDAIKRMVVRLQSIRETEFLVIDTAIRINTAVELLKEIVAVYEPEQKDDSVH